MTSLLTITFASGANYPAAVIQTFFLPEVILDDDYDYSCAFLDLIIKTKTDADLEKISKLEVLRINCDLISDGSYINGRRWHNIHQFATSATHMKGSILVEIAKNLNYFPIKLEHLQSAQISIVDQDGVLLDNYAKDINIICRISIRRDNFN